jgi:CubicO group peptidase (beta-lactamase class C family)
VLDRTFGRARTEPGDVAAAPETLWLLYSNTKVLIATAMWILAERGAFRFTDTVAEHIPEFRRNGKRDVTILQVITHQGGFPGAVVPEETWDDHQRVRETVCNFSLEWTPGSRVHYHGLSAHWVLAMLIEVLSGEDFRSFVNREVIARLGLQHELFLGIGPSEADRVSDMHEPKPEGGGMRKDANVNSAAWRRAGIPGGGAYGTARGMATLYQMMLAGGELNGVRIVSPRTLQYAIRNFTSDRIDEYMGMPMHRGLGPHLRGMTDTIRGMGSFASPRTFGHGGVGTSYCWADPDSGTSFAYITNNRIPDPWSAALQVRSRGARAFRPHRVL